MQIVYYDGAFTSIELLSHFEKLIQLNYNVLLKDGKSFATGMQIGNGVLKELNIVELIEFVNDCIVSIITEDTELENVEKVVFLGVC